ncbi:MAG: hypothetical protein ACI4Q3_00100 [Kiritimatiellia bacterium]
MSKTILVAALAVLSCGGLSARTPRVVEVAKDHPRYFESAGATWIPIGCNICFDRLYDGQAHGDAAVRANFERWMRAFAANGGNCMRVWLGHRSVEVVPDRPGVYDAARTQTLQGIVKLAETLGIKLKFTLESFRDCAFDPKAPPSVFSRPAYAPLAGNMRAFFASPECRQVYLDKARYLRKLGFGDSPAVYCWELWNEINSIGVPRGQYGAWSDFMLAELRRMFPRQMTVQNLGSFSEPDGYALYDALAEVRGNDFLQVHRYLDCGAPLDVCRGPMDVIAASATREMLRRRADVPVIVAEVGAVQPNHTGPFRHYAADRHGMLLHDEIFAPFFAGSAGSGQPWHWDHQYIDAGRLWWQFARFAKAIGGLDPVAERMTPFYTETRRLRVYGLRGTETTILWCRDKANTWEAEFERGEAPATIRGESLPFGNRTFACYLPFEDRSVTVDAPVLPPFARAIVVRFRR